MRGGPAYRRTRGESARGWSAMAAPTAMHHGRNRTMRTTATSESPCGVHGAPAGGTGLRSESIAVATGLGGTEGSVSVSFVLLLRLIKSRTICYMRVCTEEER